MANGEARQELSAALDWVVTYLESVGSHDVFSRVKPGEVEASLPPEAPENPESIEEIVGDIDRLILPGITHWNHPRFFGYFAITSSVPGIAGELISATLNTNAMLWRTSPAATELEAVATRWLAKLIGLPPTETDWPGTINDTASTSTLYALIAARNAADPQIRTKGLVGSTPLAVYCSDQAHSSVEKAIMAIGLGTDSLRRIPSDDEFQIDVQLLSEAMEHDLADGIKPAAVVATVGTTATTSVDPIAPIADLCGRFDAWLHVDAAYAGIAGALPEFRWIWDGVERADSVVVNPHKWLFVPIDCSVLYLKDPEKTRAAFSIVPEYLRSEESHNLMDYGISLGRRFRALKLWMVMRRMG
ncbi:MAG: pyridoxal phosphate-dependent decarboxylase family protein, partial [Acidimicrobiia bacterium]